MRSPLGGLVGAAGFALMVLLAGCGANTPAGTVPLVSATAPVATTGPLPPLPEQSTTTAGTPTAARTTTAVVPAEGRYCGTMRAASGLPLRVMLGEGALDCAEAERVVTRFHQAINGKQPADSDRPVSAGVDGWRCVSGPPSAHGGTTCSKGTKNVLAAVVAEE